MPGIFKLAFAYRKWCFSLSHRSHWREKHAAAKSAPRQCRVHNCLAWFQGRRPFGPEASCVAIFASTICATTGPMSGSYNDKPKIRPIPRHNGGANILCRRFLDQNMRITQSRRPPALPDDVGFYSQATGPLDEFRALARGSDIFKCATLLRDRPMPGRSNDNTVPCSARRAPSASIMSCAFSAGAVYQSKNRLAVLFVVLAANNAARHFGFHEITGRR